MAPMPLEIDGTRFRDSRGREVTFRGINVDGAAKFPSVPISSISLPRRSVNSSDKPKRRSLTLHLGSKALHIALANVMIQCGATF